MPTLSPTPISGWQRFANGSVRLFHDYASWLVGISWKRFFLLSLLLLIATGFFGSLLPSWTVTEVHDTPVRPPRPPKAPAPPTVSKDSQGISININKDGKGSGKDDFTISIDQNGVRIGPRVSAAASAASGAAGAASAAAAGASAAAGVGSIEIKLPPGATSEVVKEAVEEARSAIVDAIETAREAAQDAAQDAANAAEEAADAERRFERQYRTRTVRADESLMPLAFFFIFASGILKIVYKGRIQAETKAAVATETAESEQLKRQVVEARMAAMQAQVEPHFLFNTLASIDHLIETDPPRASTMQKNLIALLRASMPTMRENHPAAHNLGREMAVIRPYLEILKVRMEDRLQTEINVPDGLLSADFPSMMIQSLVENAIKHGLEPKAEGGTLSVKAEIVHGKLAVTVADTGLGFGKAATAGTGIGLNNIRERLQLLYGNKAQMAITENAPSGTVVTLTVPYQAQTRDGESA
ncbi:MAG: histidine kinase [Burkholderiales bacterium]|nr:histidine kinase [Burkholderiales bacterium]